MVKRPESRRSARPRTPASSRPVAGAARTTLTAAEKRTEAALRRRFKKLDEFDRGFQRLGYPVIAGVDEAGRGALAGPVVSAAVVLREDCILLGVNDSKAIDEEEREALFHMIVSSAVSVGISFSQPAAIDRHNILQATLMTMHRAVAALRLEPDLVLVDGRELFQWHGRMLPVIKGDAKSLRVAAASIVAKVARDRLMRRLHRRYPQYHFDQNKGYGTKEHLDAIAVHGVADVHRRSFLGKVVENNLSMF